MFVNEPFFFNEQKYENFIEGAILKKTKEDPITTKAKNYAAINHFFQKRNGRNVTEAATHLEQKSKTPSAVARTQKHYRMRANHTAVRMYENPSPRPNEKQ